MTEIALGLVVTSALHGFRHGFDLDHLAAIGDIVSSTPGRAETRRLSGLYIVGHAFVVFVLGVAAVALGSRIPEGFDHAMGLVVGITLIGLGIYVLYCLARRRDVPLTSGWMLAGGGVRRLARRIRDRTDVVVIEHSHAHEHSGTHAHAHPPGGGSSPEADWAATVAVSTKHEHAHVHVTAMPADPLARYSNPGAFVLGMLHGIGAETPTQLLLFASASGAESSTAGVVAVTAFVVGLVMANATVSLAAARGLSAASRSPIVYRAVAVAVGIVSVMLGVAYVAGMEPAALIGL